MLDGVLLPDRPFGEHIGFPFKFTVFRQDFQRGKEIIRRIIRERLCIGTAVDQSVFNGKAVVQGIQLSLKLMDRVIVRLLKLGFHQAVHTVPKANHAPDARFCCRVQIRMHHSRIFPVIHLVIDNRIGIVPHIGISGNAVPDGFTFGKLRRFLRTIGTGNLRDGFRQLLGQVCSIQRLAGCLLMGSVHGVIPDHSAENHIGMLGKIAVDGHTVLHLAQMHPVRLNVDGPVAFLQEDNIRSDLCTSIRLEGGIRQSDRTEQFCPLGDVFPHLRRLLIQGALGGNERHNTAGPHLIQCLGEEVIVNQEVVAVELTVSNLICAKGHVANRQIEEILPVCILKARDSNAGLRVKILCNPARNAVELYAVQPAVVHAFRQKSEEIADTA